MEYPPRYERIMYKDNNKNGNVASLTEKAKLIFFRSVGFPDWFVQRDWSVKRSWKLLVSGYGLLVQIKMIDYMDREVNPPKRVTSPTEVLHLPVNRPYYCQHFGIRCIN